MINIQILSNGKEIFSIEEPRMKAVLWHLTSRCNQRCKYCYGSFDGGSYFNNLSANIDVPLQYIENAMSQLSLQGFTRIHFCGGEVFLRKDIGDILYCAQKHNIESYVLSNFVSIPEDIEVLMTEGLFNGIAFSIDSLDEKYNLYIRGHHKQVFENINKVINIKQRNNLSTEIGLYMVLTKMNYNLIEPLLDWAENIGINYVSLQIVYLPESHPLYSELIVDNPEQVSNIYRMMEVRSFSRRSNIVLSKITDLLLCNKDLIVNSCFSLSGNHFLFIDGQGNVSSCITERSYLGNIMTDSISDCILRIPNKQCCDSFSANCLGIWEILYPKKEEV